MFMLKWLWDPFFFQDLSGVDYKPLNVVLEYDHQFHNIEHRRLDLTKSDFDLIRELLREVETWLMVVGHLEAK